MASRWTAAALAALLLTGPAAAWAEAPAATQADADIRYAVPVEQLSLGKGKGGFGALAFSVAGYNFSGATSIQSGGGISVTVFGNTRRRSRVVVDYRILKDGQPLDRGKCSVTAKTWSGLWNQTENGLYTCKPRPESQLPADFALEAALPDIPPSSSATISLSPDNPDLYNVLRARMRYDGAVYQAIPTALSPDQAARGFRVAVGWLITRDSQPVGRIDFPPRTGSGWSDVMGSYDRKSIITAPVAASDGREAVLIFAAHLYFLPEANSPLVQPE